MTFFSAARIVGACGVLCAAVGTGVGALLGLLMPEYYQAMFPRSADLDQVSLGVGLGLTQGLTIGLVVGLVIVAVLTWQYVRLSTRR